MSAIEPGRVLESVALLVAAASAAWAALACRGARRDGRAGADARVWSAVGALFLGLAFARLAQLGPSVGAGLRRLARGLHVYGDRRPLQIAVTLGLAVFALVAMSVGLRSLWDLLRRYRLAAGCVSVTVAFALIRFVSLHEIDAWNQAWPWARVAIDVGTSALASAAAIARARQLAHPPAELQRPA